MIITPGGMSAAGLRNWERGIIASGFKQTHRIRSRFGDIYLAEKKIGDHFKCWWASKDMIQEIEFPPGVSALKRKQEGKALALITLKLRESQLKELH
jgi:hypothetical protein